MTHGCGEGLYLSENRTGTGEGYQQFHTSTDSLWSEMHHIGVRMGTAIARNVGNISCLWPNYFWNKAFQIITEVLLENKTDWEDVKLFLNHYRVCSGFNWKAHVSKRCHTRASCYVSIVLTCKVTFLFISEWAYAAQRTPHREWIQVIVSIQTK